MIFIRSGTGPDVRLSIVSPPTDGKVPVTVFLPIDEKLDSGEASDILCARELAIRDVVSLKKDDE